MSFTVFVDDNFHYMDEDERYCLGSFDTLEEAVAACKGIVEEFLAANYKPGMKPEELYRTYTCMGEDPWIRGGGAGVPFSAWTYAEARCAEICLPPFEEDTRPRIIIP